MIKPTGPASTPPKDARRLKNLRAAKFTAQDEELNSALEDTFPASDPLSLTSATTAGGRSTQRKTSAVKG